MNNRFGNGEFLDIIYNYALNFPDRLNIPGNIIPVISNLMHSYDKKITPYGLAKLYRYDQYEFAVSYYETWLKQVKESCDESNFNIYNLLWLEERNCNWATSVQQDKDIGQEEFVVFNSSYLISLLLTYERVRRQRPYNELHKDLVRHLWPELSGFPYNPSRKTYVENLLAKTGLYGPAHKLKRILLGM